MTTVMIVLLSPSFYEVRKYLGNVENVLEVAIRFRVPNTTRQLYDTGRTTRRGARDRGAEKSVV